MSKRLRLPIGIQAFETIRENGYTYVDKTEQIFRLVDEGMFYFLSRPRRFGKSLLVSTLKCFFEGKKSLFEGLWIEQEKQLDWEKHPVILIDFNEISHGTEAELRLGLRRAVKETAEQYGISLQSSLLKENFQELILAAQEKMGKSVVVLVDEYDKPIIDHLGRGKNALEVAMANRDVLKQFFGVLKGGNVSPCLRFVFLTGISKFSKVSLFSELNNLFDLTMNRAHADLCGYTELELIQYFSDYLEAFRQELGCSTESLLQKLAQHYNGYRFSGKGNSIYNPFSMLKCLREMEFKNYWFESGSPTFLINLLKERQFDIPQIENLTMDLDEFSTYDVENLKPEALLFQTGYLTIQSYDGEDYTLGYPNQEVKSAFLKSLWGAYTDLTNGASPLKRLSRCLEQGRLDEFFEIMKASFASIPYMLNSKRDESYFHTLFYLMLSRVGILAHNEVLTSRGRIDMVVEFADKIFIIEFKCNQSAEKALKQIQDKGYAEQFSQQGKSLHLLGINFSTETRNVGEWKLGE